MEYELPARPYTVGAIPKAYAKSETVLKLLQQIHEEARGPVEKPKPPQKNFLKENLKRLKDIQAKTQQKLVQKQSLQPLKVPNRYSHTQAKVFTNTNGEIFKEKPMCDTMENIRPPKTAGPFRNRRPCSPCLSTKSEDYHSLQSYRSLPHLNQSDNAEKVPESIKNNSKIQRNGYLPNKEGKATKHRKDESETKSETKHQLGKIPNYLTERKKQWELEKEKQQKLLEEASVPEGYTLLPDEERVETLELLKKNQEELIRALSTLPVRNDTMRLRNHKEELERQLAKVEEGIKIFSRPKVLIKNDT